MRKSAIRNHLNSSNACFEALEQRQLLAADLAASLSYTAGTYYPGMSIAAASLAELNIGRASEGQDGTASGFTTRLVLSTDRIYGNDNDLELSIIAPSGDVVTPGAIARRDLALPITSEFAAGTYYLLAFIDSGAAITEESETNNLWVSANPDIVIARASVTVVATDQSASENGPNTGRFRFTRTGPVTAPLTVRYTLGGAVTPAGEDADIEALSGSITIPANQSTVNLIIRPIDDSHVEGVERLTLTLAPDAAYTIGAQRTGRIDITDNDGSRVRITATDPTATERAAGTATFTVSRVGSVDDDIVVRYTVSGSATGGTDFTALSGVVELPSGKVSETITITPIDDLLGEASETVIITLVNSPEYIVISNRRTARATIADDEPVVKVLATDAVATELGAGTATFTISRSVVSATVLNVAYTLGGTSTATGEGFDFAALTGMATIAANQLSTTVVITPVDDGRAEPNETVVLILASESGYRLDPVRNRASATIRDNTPTVSITASDSTASENNASTGSFTFTRTGSTIAALAVQYSIAGSAATDGSDYVALTGEVIIPPSQLAAIVFVVPIDDRVGEGSETVVLTVISGDYYHKNSARQTSRVTIADNEPAVSVVATDAGASEAELQTGIFTISRTGSTVGSLTVLYTISGTATSAGIGVLSPDFEAIAGIGSITIPDGSSGAIITITPVDDAVAELAESIVLTVGAGNGYVVSPSRRAATITLTDDEPTIAIIATDATASETRADSDTGLATFTISRATAGTSPLVVNYTISGTAENGPDYSPLDTTVTIPTGQTSVVISVSPVDDTIGEGNETVILTLATSTTYTLQSTGGRDRATATIRDNEQIVSIVALDNTATELNETEATLRFTRTGTTQQLASELTVSFLVSGTAETGDDFEPLEGIVIFVPGAATADLSIYAIDDSTGESAETVVLTIESGGIYAVDPAKSAATITIIDNEPVVSVTATDAAASENNNPGAFTFTRTGSTEPDLVVNYTVGGTATMIDDYAALSGSVTIAAGAATAVLSVAPVYDLLTESTETIILTLSSGESYRLDANAVRSRATINLANALAVDLSVTSISYAAGSWSLGSAGLQVPLAISIASAGSASSGLFRYEVRLSANTIWGDSDDVIIYNASQPSIGAGGTESLVATVNYDAVKALLTEGRYYVACRVDVASNVIEQSESNNTLFSVEADITVTA